MQPSHHIAPSSIPSLEKEVNNAHNIRKNWRNMSNIKITYTGAYSKHEHKGIKYSFIHSSMALQPFVGPWPLLQFHNHLDIKYRCVNNSQIQAPSTVFAIITHYEVMHKTQKRPSL
jgi:hypothetical protein